MTETAREMALRLRTFWAMARVSHNEAMMEDLELLCELALAAQAMGVLMLRPGESHNDCFERVADAFQRDTGLLRPGKSVPLEMCVEGYDKRRQDAWDEWCGRIARGYFAAIQQAENAGILKGEPDEIRP